ncbi:MAG TPA: gamma-glutamyltransferase [Longimicrobiales bacterium]
MTRLTTAFALLFVAACAGARAPERTPISLPDPGPGPTLDPAPTPDPVPGPDAGRRVAAKNGVVSSANALASEAGIAMLRAGGNAIDAAVATAFALGVVEPQMSGVGGGGAALVWIEADARPYYLDFYASQPADAFRGHTGPRRGPDDLRIVGVPGNVAGLLALHERWGTLPLEQVMAPAIRLAEHGFPIGQVLAEMIASDSAEMSVFPETWRRYWPDGRPLGAGEILRNPELAATLRRIAAEGRAGFYDGPVAEQLVAALNAGGHPLTRADLAAYQPRWMRPLCTDYRGHAVLSAPPPQTGMQVLHTLELLEPFDLPRLGLPTRSAAAFDVLASALRVGTTARAGNADPAWVPVPAAGLASEAFARARADLVGTGRAAAKVEPADARPFDDAAPPASCRRYDPYGPAQPIAASAAPAGRTAPAPAPRMQPAPPAPPASPAPGAAADGTRTLAPERDGETTHLSVVDRFGNAVSLTQTNSTLFGSGAWVAGFFLNDSGFRFTDENIDAPSRRRWRTRTTTIAPTLVLDGDDVRLVVGAPGGGRIPTAIVQAIVYVLDYGMDPLDAVRMPRMFPAADSPRVQLEHGFAPATLRDARAMGYDPAPSGFGYARLYLIARQGDAWIGVADPRHDGEPRGY